MKKIILIVALALVLCMPVFAEWWNVGDLSTDLELYYPMNESTGTDIYEISSGDLNMTATSINWVVDDLGFNATNFDTEGSIVSTVATTDLINFTSKNYTISWRMNVTNLTASADGNMVLLDYWSEQPFLFKLFDRNLRLVVDAQEFDGYKFPLDEWHTYSVVFTNASGTANASLYVDGIYNQTIILNATESTDALLNISENSENNFTGELREFSFIADSLNELEVLDLNNTMDGFYVLENALAHNIETVGRNMTINCTATDETNVTNVSIVFNGSTNYTASLVGSGSESIEYTIENLVNGQYEWSCDARDNENNLAQSSSRNFTVLDFIDNERFSNGETLEGATESFQVNISVNLNNLINAAIFTYNNTVYSPVISKTSENYTLTNTFTIPAVIAGASMEFNWTLNFTDGTQGFLNSSHQNASNLNMDNCTSYSNRILNYTLVDEDTQSTINGTVYNTTIEVEVEIFPQGDRTTPIMNFSQKFENISYAEVCTENDLNSSSYDMNVMTFYDGDSYAPEYHYIQNYTLNNNTLDNNITLYDLLDSRSTDFKITFKDDTFLGVEGALIDVTRKYVADGVFKSVEVGETDAAGQTIVHLVEAEGIYTIIVKKEGEILATFENQMAICDDSVIGDCFLNLNEQVSSTDVIDFEDYFDIISTILFNRTSRVVSATFTVKSGATASMLLNVTKFDNYRNTTLCSDSIVSSSGTLECDIPISYGNATIDAWLYKDNTLVNYGHFSISEDPREIFGGTEVILIIMLLATLPLMAISSIIGMMIMVIMGLILAIALSLITTSDWFGVASFITWFIIAAILIIWKISQGGKE